MKKNAIHHKVDYEIFLGVNFGGVVVCVDFGFRWKW